MPEDPIVLDGLRGQRPAREAAAKLAPRPTRVEPPGDGTLYISKYASYRHQITSPVQQLTTDGTLHREPALVAQFHNHMYRNNHKDKKTRAFIDKRMQEDSPYFGMGNLFWLASEQMVAERAKAAKEAALLISRDPELQAEIERQVALRLGKSEDLPAASA